MESQTSVLIAQVIGLLKEAYEKAGLQLPMAPYGVIATDYECGIIEVRGLPAQTQHLQCAHYVWTMPNLTNVRHTYTLTCHRHTLGSCQKAWNKAC